jgi:hypothetical protein
MCVCVVGGKGCAYTCTSVYSKTEVMIPYNNNLDFRYSVLFFHQLSHLIMLEVAKLLMVAGDCCLTTEYKVKVVSILNLHMPPTQKINMRAWK